MLVKDNLHQKTENFDFENPPTDPSQLAIDLAETMIMNNGLGLSSNQIGLEHRVFVMTGSPILACFNPKIVDQSKEEVLLEEGCLSYPGLFIKIKRPRRIKVRYTQPDGEVVTKTFADLTARVFQHEMDHLDGIDFRSRANKYHLNQALKNQKKTHPKESTILQV